MGHTALLNIRKTKKYSQGYESKRPQAIGLWKCLTQNEIVREKRMPINMTSLGILTFF